MTNSRDRVGSGSISLMLIEDDPIFRLGLVTGLREISGIQVVLDVPSTRALQTLQSWFERPSPTASEAEQRPALDLVVLSLDLPPTITSPNPGLVICQQLKASYPDLPVLLLGKVDSILLASAFQTGAEGFCLKGAEVSEIVQAIQQLAAGQPYWEIGMQAMARSLTTPATSLQSPPAQRPLAKLRYTLHRSSLQQIEAAMALIADQLQNADLSLVDQLVLTGRRRELRAARWLVNQLLETAPPPPAPASAVPSRLPIPPSVPSANLAPLTAPPPQPPSEARRRSLQTALFDATASKLQFSLQNLTDRPLEIDILRLDKRRELLYLVLRKLEDVLDDLRFSQVSPEHILEKQPTILLDLWRATTTDFFGKYYTLPLGSYGIRDPQIFSAIQLPNQEVELVEVLLRDADIIQSFILNKIPLLPQFITHLLFQTPLMIDDSAYAGGTVEAMGRMELLLDNLTLQIGNAVIQPLLNRFGDVVAIKQTFYDKRLLSSREIERFRNDLSWHYRLEKYIGEPTAIFESRFNLLALREAGITQTLIYAPRNQELTELEGLQYAVTLVLETRDAIAPRLRSAVSFLGSGVVYLLTEVVGRGIGLIGRGIVKGIGNALQETKVTRHDDPPR